MRDTTVYILSLSKDAGFRYIRILRQAQDVRRSFRKTTLSLDFYDELTSFDSVPNATILFAGLYSLSDLVPDGPEKRGIAGVFGPALREALDVGQDSFPAYLLFEQP